MAYIHTIQIVDEKHSGSTVSSTRRSENRKYAACIVATTTADTLRVCAERKARVEEELSAWRKKLAERVARLGVTVEEAVAWRKEAQDRWYGAGGIFDTEARIRATTGAAGERLSRLTKADLLARGFEDPYDIAGRYGICEAEDAVSHRAAVLKDWRVPRVGSQSVISWHGTVPLAQKALGALDAIRRLGDRLDIRTDITIFETKKRAVRA